MVVKSFRGLLADGGQERICLETLRGKVGYRIVKFQAIDGAPGTANVESVTKIFNAQQTTIDGVVDFSDSDLLGVYYYTEAGTASAPGFQAVIFDNELFNQDIFVTHVEPSTNSAGNYYIELEVIPLTDHAAEFTTLKDIRGRTDLAAKPTP